MNHDDIHVHIYIYISDCPNSVTVSLEPHPIHSVFGRRSFFTFMALARQHTEQEGMLDQQKYRPVNPPAGTSWPPEREQNKHIAHCGLF